MSAAAVFPGMGEVRFADTARVLLATPEGRAALAEADEALGYALIPRWRAEDVPYGTHAQVGFLVVSVAQARATLPDAPIVAGASFGGKGAAVHAGALSLGAAVAMSRAMAEVEADYFAGAHGDLVTHSFVRVPVAGVGELLADLAARGRPGFLSCRVDQELHMVTVSESDVDWLDRAIRAKGGMSLYTMRPAVHAPVLAGLRARVAAEVVADVPIADPRVPVVVDQDGSVVTTAEGVRTGLLDGYTRAVDWPAVLRTLSARGVRRLHMCGPDALFGRVRAARDAFEVVGPRHPAPA